MEIPELLKNRVVIGVENEWDIIVTKNGKLQIDFFQNQTRCTELLSHCVPEKLKYGSLVFKTSNASKLIVWLKNGSKLYFDVGDHLEYAACEGSGAMHALINEKSGDKIVEMIVCKANEFWSKEGVRIRIFKRNVDAVGKPSSGTHENYLIPRHLMDSLCTNPLNSVLRSFLSGFLATRIIFTGNGLIKFDKKTDSVHYHISQRANFIDSEWNNTTTELRPLINTRDEPQADKSKYARLHLICGDALTLEPAIFLRFGTMEIVLAMIICEFIEKLPWSTDVEFFLALRAFSENPTLRQTYQFRNKKLTAINIQEEYFRLAKLFCEKVGYLGEEWPKIMKLWEDAINAAKQPKPHEKLRGISEWAAKLCLIETDMDRVGYSWNTPIYSTIVKKTANNPEYSASFSDHLKTMDALFHENCPSGYARILMQRGVVEKIADPVEINKAMFVPKPVNRAYARHLEHEALNRAAEEKKSVYLVISDWYWLTAKNISSDELIGTAQDLEPQSIESNFMPTEHGERCFEILNELKSVNRA